MISFTLVCFAVVCIKSIPYETVSNSVSKVLDYGFDTCHPVSLKRF